VAKEHKIEEKDQPPSFLCKPEKGEKRMTSHLCRLSSQHEFPDAEKKKRGNGQSNKPGFP